MVKMEKDYLVSSRSQVHEILDFAEKAGAKLIKPAQEADWGGYSGYFSETLMVFMGSCSRCFF